VPSAYERALQIDRTGMAAVRDRAWVPDDAFLYISRT
jgi:hypothetical protein